MDFVVDDVTKLCEIGIEKQLYNHHIEIGGTKDTFKKTPRCPNCDPNPDYCPDNPNKT